MEISALDAWHIMVKLRQMLYQAYIQRRITELHDMDCIRSTLSCEYSAVGPVAYAKLVMSA
jgi:hypothetical protein